MPFLDKLKKIENYLGKIAQLNESLEVSQEINRLQADLVKEYLRDLYELYAELEQEGKRKTPAPEVPPLATVSSEKVDISSQETEDSVPDTGEVHEVPTSPEVKPAVPAQDVSASDPSPKEASTAAVAEADEPISLLEKFQQQSTGKDMNRKPVSEKPLSDLIPLNEKFMFIMEFFDNSISRYENALAELEKMAGRKEVLAYMDQHAWSEEILESQKDLVDRFIRIIDLKFPA